MAATRSEESRLEVLQKTMNTIQGKMEDIRESTENLIKTLATMAESQTRIEKKLEQWSYNPRGDQRGGEVQGGDHSEEEETRGANRESKLSEKGEIPGFDGVDPRSWIEKAEQFVDKIERMQAHESNRQAQQLHRQAVGRNLEDTNSRNLEDLNSSYNNRRVKHPLFSTFRSDDAVNYFDIATVPVDRCVLDFEEDEDDSDPDDAESEEDDDEGDDGSIVGQDLDGEGTTCMAVIDVNEMMVSAASLDDCTAKGSYSEGRYSGGVYRLAANLASKARVERSSSQQSGVRVGWIGTPMYHCLRIAHRKMEGPGVEEKEESVWASSLSCLRYFVYDRGKIRRSRLKGLDIRVIKALVRISRRNSWAQIIHCKLNDYSADLDVPISNWLLCGLLKSENSRVGWGILFVVERLLIRCKYQFPSTSLEDKAEIKSEVLLWAKLLMAQAQIKGLGPRIGVGAG
ncbi:hypothetical protein F511_05958 [Dorcoceras hygrometricum]|uniref:Uncharacterized protein n=1 Tax=Dorcoceras hygrometricum TaxID=472368 RepID=A0A2Z7DCQ5_9LAMI|nr:hypothetical protein F511_05958 [Dorcoceras hygrometricum]